MKFKIYLITALSQLVVWVLFNVFIGGDLWVEDKLKEILFATAAFVFISIFGGITYFFRPLSIKISQNNIMNENMKDTIIDIQEGEVKTLQNQRTISFSIKFERRGSIWWRILKLLLRNQKFIISFQSIPNNVGLQHTRTGNRMFSPNVMYGINFDFTKYFLQFLDSDGRYSIVEKHEYFIVIHPMYSELLSSGTYLIVPRLEIIQDRDSKVLTINSWILKKLLKKDIEEHKLTISMR